MILENLNKLVRSYQEWLESDFQSFHFKESGRRRPPRYLIKKKRLELMAFGVGDRPPVLLVPPFMVSPIAFDLMEERSLLRFLLSQGFDVYVLDFGVPDKDYADDSLETYVAGVIPEAVEAICKDSGAERIMYLGYCMGGILGIMYAAIDDSRLSGLITLGSPVNFSRTRLIRLLSVATAPLVRRLSELYTNIPGWIPKLGMRLTSPLTVLSRFNLIFERSDELDDDRVRAFFALQRYSDSFIPYPKGVFLELVEHFIIENILYRGAFKINDKVVDLSAITTPLLAFAGRTDSITPPDSISTIMERVSSTDTRFETVSGGHLGVLLGTEARTRVWPLIAEWIKQHTCT